MKLARPTVSATVAMSVFAKCLGRPPEGIAPIDDEQISASFECRKGEVTYIVHFREMNMAFGLTKERFLSVRLRAASVPIREVVGDGTYQGLQYTIERKPRGTRLAHLCPMDFGAALPSVFDTLLSLASVDLGGTAGYGWFGSSGVAAESTWQAHLSRIRDEEPGLFFGNWHSMFETTFLERERFERYYERMIELLDNVRIPRSLVHGSFQAFNVLSQNGRVSAVLDWQDARFGDPIFDVASMDFWPTGYDFADMYKAFCIDRGMTYPNYGRRIAASKYYQALGAMLYYAKIDTYDAYQKVVDIAEALDGKATNGGDSAE